ncbi:putative cyclase-domain-containing protein [Paraphoma chrysanthemicola]|uniref:Cyclase-domain-containing protein n=1 Tax=Paraphoma chrysanthemicola TaxID=798071 RepID=A0A8K0R6S6_9PLEO|nr:putative cyclase-domain-containing protein [Paraphoma chrysanthemicola]
MTRPFPKFSELPLDEFHPPNSAWGLWGPDDELGTLNHLTAKRTVEAAKLVKTGTRIGLNWSLEQMDFAGDFRQLLKHEIFELGKNMNDDRLTFNTQTSSQWDGLRHWGFDDGRFYNGLTQAEIHSNATSKLGIHAWAKQGIVGRGVLIDFASYAAHNDIAYDPLDHFAISFSTFHKIAEASNITFQPGDIILLRTQFTAAFESASLDAKKAIFAKSPFEYPGLEASPQALEFLWNTQIAAVAGDCPGFEAWPPAKEAMHQTLLSGFGMPIGELFDLEDLARECMKQQRWSFFFTSQVLNVKGGVASPPNAIAIF